MVFFWFLENKRGIQTVEWLRLDERGKVAMQVRGMVDWLQDKYKLGWLVKDVSGEKKALKKRKKEEKKSFLALLQKR